MNGGPPWEWESTGLVLTVRRYGELIEVELLRCPACGCLVDYERVFERVDEDGATRHRAWHDRA